MQDHLIPDTAIDGALARARDAVRDTPADPSAWLALASLLEQTQRHDDQARVLGEALSTMPDNPELNLAAGLSDLRRGRNDQARDRLARAADLDRASPIPSLALARIAESAGDLMLALAHYSEAVRRDARHAARLVTIGLALHRNGQIDAATEAFRRATEAQPAFAEAWGNLAAMLGEAGRTADALATLDRALSLAPEIVDLHALRGDLLRLSGRVREAAEAYAYAARLRPDAPELLNKLGCTQWRLGDVTSAEESLRQAVAVAPTFALARASLGTLCAQRHRFAESRTLLSEALGAPDLSTAARREAAATLTIMDEHESLAHVIADAVAQENETPIFELRARVADDSLPFDEQKLATFEWLSKNAAAARDTHRFAIGRAEWPDWGAVEAHFALHLGDEPETVHRSVARLAAAAVDRAAESMEVREMRGYVRALRQRRILALSEDSGVLWESRLRLWHALLTWEHPEILPGQFKFTLNCVSTSPLVRRARPEDVAGTIRRFYSGPYRNAIPGPWRAALVYFAIVDIHGFFDGNGRLARFLVNLELERAGFRPIILTDRAMRSGTATLTAVRELNDLEPLVDLFARASAETTALLPSLVVGAELPR